MTSVTRDAAADDADAGAAPPGNVEISYLEPLLLVRRRGVQRQEPQLHGAALRVPGVGQPRLQLHRYVRLPLRPAILLLQGHGQWHGPPGGLGN